MPINICTVYIHADIMVEYSHLLKMIDSDLSVGEKKQRVLRELDLFVLDNSLRESAVGQLRGHTLENKWSILEEIKKCGFKNAIVSSFSDTPGVDDSFVKLLSEREPDMSNYFAFSEIGEGHMKQDLPVGLKKMQQYRISNPILEVDLCIHDVIELQHLLQKRIDYTYENLSTDAKILVNIRDIVPAMIRSPTTVFDMVEFLGTMRADKRLFGIMFEEPTGDYYPYQLGAWTKSVRLLMNECDWQSGHLLVHIHKKWEYAEVTQMECLANGADGVWASICKEGGPVGHACSTNTIMNLVRMGNTKVLKRFNCHYLRQAAITITEATTGRPPHPEQTIYGECALDVVFDLDGDETGFNLSGFFGTEAPNRITIFASPAMIKDRLVHIFGENEHFTEDVAVKMKALMINDLVSGRKEEYTSTVSLANLFGRVGGKLTDQMRGITEKIR